MAERQGEGVSVRFGLAQGVTLVYLSLAWFGLIDGVIEWVARRRSVPLGWAALVVLPLALSFEAIWPLFFAAGCLGAVGFHLARRRLKHQSDPESLLLFFCSRLSTVLSGAVAGLTIALFFFSAGLLDLWELWNPARLGALVAAGAGGGALLGWLRKAIRSRWPEPLIAGSGTRVANVATARGAAISAPFTSGGFWIDEVILSVVATPFLWAGLSEIHPMWHLIFLYGWIFLPTLLIYMIWAGVHTAWLRWAGVIDPKDRRLYEAYEVLMSDDYVQQWLGEISVDYDPKAHRYYVTGVLPRSHHLATVKTRLGAIGGASVDVSGVRIDPDLLPNARLELALSRSRRHKGRERVSR